MASGKPIDQERQVSASYDYDDARHTGVVMESASDAQANLNDIRTLIRLITGRSDWFLAPDASIADLIAAIAAMGLNTFQLPAAVDLVAGDVVSTTALNTLDLASSTSVGTADVSGIVTTGALAGFSATVGALGILELADWTHITGSAALTPGQDYFLSPTPGKLQLVGPASGWLTVVGRSITTQKLAITPEVPIKRFL